MWPSWAAGALVAATLFAGPVRADDSVACGLVSQIVLRSCRSGAQSEFWLTVGRCNNLEGSAARRICLKRATAAQRDDLDACAEQREGRDEVCGEVDGEPYDPRIDPQDFVDRIDNPYLPLRPGTTFVYEGRTDEGFEHIELAVTHNTKTILGVTCVEVRDVVTVDGEVKEDTLDWFAQDRQGNVWYFGENSKELEDGLIVSLEGTWTSGEDGAKPGIIMKAHPGIGDFYRQEFSLDVAEDVAEVVSLTDSVTVPYGSFTQCLRTKEWTPMSPGAEEFKVYARGIGLVKEVDPSGGEELNLVRIVRD